MYGYAMDMSLNRALQSLQGSVFFYLYLVWGAMRGAMTFANKSDSEQFNTNKNLKNRITKPNTNIWKVKRQV